MARRCGQGRDSEPLKHNPDVQIRHAVLQKRSRRVRGQSGSGVACPQLIKPVLQVPSPCAPQTPWRLLEGTPLNIPPSPVLISKPQRTLHLHPPAPDNASRLGRHDAPTVAAPRAFEGTGSQFPPRPPAFRSRDVPSIAILSNFPAPFRSTPRQVGLWLFWRRFTGWTASKEGRCSTQPA